MDCCQFASSLPPWYESSAHIQDWIFRLKIRLKWISIAINSHVIQNIPRFLKKKFPVVYILNKKHSVISATTRYNLCDKSLKSFCWYIVTGKTKQSLYALASWQIHKFAHHREYRERFPRRNHDTCHEPGSFMGQIMAFPKFGTKILPKSLLGYCQLDLHCQLDP